LKRDQKRKIYKKALGYCWKQRW